MAVQAKYMSPKEVAEEYGLNENTLRCYRSEGRGPRYLKVGKLVKYRRADVESWLDAQVVETADSMRLQVSPR